MTKSIDLIPTWFWPEGIPRHISLPRATAFVNTVERWTRRRPDTLAISGPRPTTYSRLDELARAASTNLTRSMAGRQSRRATLVVGPDLDSIIVLLGAMHAGLDALLIDETTPPGRRSEAAVSYRSELVVAAHPIPEDGRAITFEECMGEPDPVETAQRGIEGRVAFEWDTSVVLHPTATLLGWALAFRAFTALQPADRFLTSHRPASWEGVTALLAALAVGSSYALPVDLLHSLPPDDDPPSGAWIARDQANAIADDPQASRWLESIDWMYLSVDDAMPARMRRRIARRLGTPALTILGTPATGPVAASPREWFIDEAVGIPFTGVDLIPLDEAQRPADPPWHLLTAARMGVQSSLITEGFEIEGPRRGSILPDRVVDIGTHGRMDANGFLYLL
jgi:hypothetical protein